MVGPHYPPALADREVQPLAATRPLPPDDLPPVHAHSLWSARGIEPGPRSTDRRASPTGSPFRRSGGRPVKSGEQWWRSFTWRLRDLQCHLPAVLTTTATP